MSGTCGKNYRYKNKNRRWHRLILATSATITITVPFLVYMLTYDVLAGGKFRVVLFAVHAYATVIILPSKLRYL